MSITGDVTVGLAAAGGAHLAAGAPIRLRMHLGFGEAEHVTQPLADVFERGRLRCRPGIPIRPVPGFDGVGQRLLVVAGNPVHPQPRMLRDRDQRVIVVVPLEIQLDGDVVGNRADDAR